MNRNTRNTILLDGKWYVYTPEDDMYHEIIETPVENNSKVETPVENTSKNKHWDHTEILHFMTLCQQNREKLNSPKFVNKEIYQEIANELKQKGYIFTPLQCENKLKTLLTKYKSIVDHNSKTGNDRKDWVYLSLMEDFAGNKPNIKPIAMCSSLRLNDNRSCATSSEENLLNHTDFQSSVSPVGVKTREIASNEERSFSEDSQPSTSNEGTKKRKSENVIRKTPRHKMMKWLENYSKTMESREEARVAMFKQQHADTLLALREIIKKMDHTTNADPAANNGHNQE